MGGTGLVGRAGDDTERERSVVWGDDRRIPLCAAPNEHDSRTTRSEFVRLCAVNSFDSARSNSVESSQLKRAAPATP